MRTLPRHFTWIDRRLRDRLWELSLEEIALLCSLHLAADKSGLSLCPGAPHRCAIGSWGGRRPSRRGDVTVTGAHGRGERRRRAFVLPTLRAPARVWGKDPGVEVDTPVIASCRRGDRVCESVAGILDAAGRPLAWPGSHAMPCRVDVTETVTHAVRQRATGRNFPQRLPRTREGASL